MWKALFRLNTLLFQSLEKAVLTPSASSIIVMVMNQQDFKVITNVLCLHYIFCLLFICFLKRSGCPHYIGIDCELAQSSLKQLKSYGEEESLSIISQCSCLREVQVLCLHNNISINNDRNVLFVCHFWVCMVSLLRFKFGQTCSRKTCTFSLYTMHYTSILFCP